MKFYSTKTFGHERGLSCCFRQWRAESHCNLLHGYSIGVKLVFQATSLDERNWVYDFGNTKWIKALLDETFDHTTVVAQDDPMLAEFHKLHEAKIINLKILPDVGCEKFAEWIYAQVNGRVLSETQNRVSLKSVEVMEHGSNSALVEM